MRGYYSLIQFCPDSARGELANIGLLVMCPGIEFCKAIFADGNDRVQRFFELPAEDLSSFEAAKDSFIRRIENDNRDLTDLSRLEHFIGTRANSIRMTAPRNLRIDSPREDLATLFAELVGGKAIDDLSEDQS